MVPIKYNLRSLIVRRVGSMMTIFGVALTVAVFVSILVFMGLLARRGVLPRTRRIVPGEWAISD